MTRQARVSEICRISKMEHIHTSELLNACSERIKTQEDRIWNPLKRDSQFQPLAFDL